MTQSGQLLGSSGFFGGGLRFWVAFCAWSGPWRTRRRVVGDRRRDLGAGLLLLRPLLLLLGLLVAVGQEVARQDRRPGAVGGVDLDPGVDVGALDLAGRRRGRAEHDAGLDAQPVGGERQRRGVLLVVAGQLLGPDEPLEPGERVAGQEDVLVVPGRAAVGVGAGPHRLGDRDDLGPRVRLLAAPGVELGVHEPERLGVDDGRALDGHGGGQVGRQARDDGGELVGVAAPQRGRARRRCW